MKKIWNNFRDWLFYKTISRETKATILRMAKMFCEQRHPSYGMCNCIYKAADMLLPRPAYRISLIRLFPEFNREYLGGSIGYGLYWWDPEDKKVRLEAFDKLIELYW